MAKQTWCELEVDLSLLSPPKTAKKLPDTSGENANAFAKSIPKSMAKWWT
jgi:hypothetical protein